MLQHRYKSLAFTLAIACTACAKPALKRPEATAAPEQKASAKKPKVQAVPFFEGLDSYKRAITTDSALAQRYFNQGLALLQGFNHFAAAQSFQAAATADPDCLMAYVGLALANGPHINRWAMTPLQTKEAWRALQLGKNAKHATAVERDLFEAVSVRYVPEEVEDRKALDQTYADAMRKLWAKYPNDVDIGAFFAEAMMMLRPWDYWDKKGNPNPGTPEIRSTLEQLMRVKADHPLVLHLYIHAIEGSQSPQDALPAADRLRALVPGHSHLLHMPSHIDSRTGNWKGAVETNIRAVAADEAQLAKNPEQDFYLLYMLHNRHLLTYAAMMVGRSKEAIFHANKIVERVPEAWIEAHPARADGYYAMPLAVYMRFGKWDEILAMPPWPKPLALARTLRHYARGVAYAATLEPELARKELEALKSEAKEIKEDRRFGSNTAQKIATLAQRFLEGEVLYREGKVDAGIEKLKEAAALEDALAYGEPPSWIQPVRHALGAALLGQKRFAEAEAVFRKDLTQKPHNGWGLWGLARALERQGKAQEAKEVQARFETAWQDADIKLSSSCLCLPGV